MTSAKKIIPTILSLWLTLFCTVVAAQQRLIDIAVGWSKPPYVIAKQDSGFEIELVRAVFARIGYATNFVYVPFARSYALLKEGEVDAAMTVSDKVDIGEAFLSDVYIEYQNIAVSLLEENLLIENIVDLKNYSVIAFQNANKVLGPEFAQMTRQNRHYQEFPDQDVQIKMLFRKKTNVIVLDANIFLYNSNKLNSKDTHTSVNMHLLFEATGYRMGFIDKALVEQFNDSFAEYQNSAEYLDLLKRYTFYKFD